MTKSLTEFEFELTEPITIHKGGEMAKSNKLLLKAPSNSHRYHLTKLKQGFMRSILSMSQSNNRKSVTEQNKDESSFDAKVILMLLLASDLDFNEYMDNFKNLICSNNICLVDGKIAMNNHLFDQLNEYDSEQLLGKYIESFLLSSWMNLLGTK